MMGIPGSGKSTYVSSWAEQMRDNGQEPIIICPDDIREELTGDAGDQSANAEVFELAHQRLTQSLRSDSSVIFFDATNVKKFARRGILDIVRHANVGEKKVFPMLVVINENLGQCKLRNTTRERVVPEQAMDRMHSEMLKALDDVEKEGWGRVIHA